MDSGVDEKGDLGWAGWSEDEDSWGGGSLKDLGSWFQRWGAAWRKEWFVTLREDNVGGRLTVTTDEERVFKGAEDWSGCEDMQVEK